MELSYASAIFYAFSCVPVAVLVVAFVLCLFVFHLHTSAFSFLSTFQRNDVCASSLLCILFMKLCTCVCMCKYLTLKVYVCINWVSAQKKDITALYYCFILFFFHAFQEYCRKFLFPLILAHFFGMPKFQFVFFFRVFVFWLPAVLIRHLKHFY